MPRANRNFCEGLIWHITHRCHQQEFLLRFVRDRRRWRHWLFEAKRRYGLSALNYIATCNHIHLLVADQGMQEISQSMQLIAGRTAQEYNQRRKRRGAFWEDRYHATAVQSDSHLIRCLSYIDLNMVRAGVVRHPREWDVSGYHEIQRPRARKAIIDQVGLCNLVGISSNEQLKKSHGQWIEEFQVEHSTRNPVWTASVAVGDENFLSSVRNQLGVSGMHRKIRSADGTNYLQEPSRRYQRISHKKSRE